MKARAIVLFAAALAVADPAAAQMSRAGRSEIYLGPVFTDGKSWSFNGGSTARTDTGVGLAFGYAYNFSPQLSAGFDIEWNEQDYRANVMGSNINLGNNRQVSGTIESRTFRFNGTYNFLSREFTPFVTGGLGWTYVDSNIPTGQLEGFCWYYPWYGEYCTAYVPTHTTTKFSYNAGFGLRLDAGKGVFRLAVNSQWIDFGGSYGDGNVIQYRLDFGTKF